MGINLDSHASCKKNFIKSNLDIALPINTIFVSVLEYDITNDISRASRKHFSILLPKPNLSILGRFL